MPQAEQLTPMEKKAYRKLARAALQLREAQESAIRDRNAKQDGKSEKRELAHA